MKTVLVSLLDPATASDLGEFLRRRVDAIVDRRTLRELEVSFVGSFSDEGLREEIELAVERWCFVRRRPDELVVVGRAAPRVESRNSSLGSNRSGRLPRRWPNPRSSALACVLLADDHRLILDDVRAALEDSGEFEVVGEATTGSQGCSRS